MSYTYPGRGARQTRTPDKTQAGSLAEGMWKVSSLQAHRQLTNRKLCARLLAPFIDQEADSAEQSCRGSTNNSCHLPGELPDSRELTPGDHL